MDCSWPYLPPGGFGWRIRQRLFRLCDGPRRIRCRLVAHHNADRNRDPDCRVWSDDPGLRHLATAPCTALEEYLAHDARQRDRHSDRRCMAGTTRTGNPLHLRFAVGVLLVMYTIYGFACPLHSNRSRSGSRGRRPHWHVQWCTRRAFTGLGGVISTISLPILRVAPGYGQRAVFQPVLFAAFVVISVSLAAAGAVTRTHTTALRARGGPFLLAGLWAGFRLYGKIDDELFRKSVLVLLLFSGLSLIISAALPFAFRLAWTGQAEVARCCFCSIMLRRNGCYCRGLSFRTALAGEPLSLTARSGASGGVNARPRYERIWRQRQAGTALLGGLRSLRQPAWHFQQ